eukprot:CAMPEP_0185252998 /NCGR_PEP_ID=MMETSP1359-20130426/1920_1 /TAXON_ID=552665 /ORGANISM="Bigelowiella longifila, Strain CCMP242" /LENGTH=260 /DNA_ID=CAMNT_0027835297 /DNA_START=72 /DNA_END=855 /DNA_ORIENTATION=-
MRVPLSAGKRSKPQFRLDGNRSRLDLESPRRKKMKPSPMKTIASDIVAALQSCKDSSKAVMMKKYMREKFDFFGVSAPDRRDVLKPYLKGKKAVARTATTEELIELMGYLWNEDMRECQYAACDVLVLHETLNKDKAESLTSAVKELVVSKSWWDTVDYLASVIGNTLIHEGMLNVMDGWIKDDSIWVRRVAIICQNKRKTKTDAKRLFQYCKEHASDTEFFIAKAIGWSLRSYAYTDPDAVQRFVEETNGLQNSQRGKH